MSHQPSGRLQLQAKVQKFVGVHDCRLLQLDHVGCCSMTLELHQYYS
ncbi:hypothetical protein DFAR_2880004 [Desulfarculales bacterium]